MIFHNFKTTIGIDNFRKDYTFKDQTIILYIWDTAG